MGPVADRPQDTDWQTILGLYNVLRILWPNPVVESTARSRSRWSTVPRPPWPNSRSYRAIRGCASTHICPLAPAL